jgi:hypothetical protein
MTIITRAMLRGTIAGLAMLIGAVHGHADAALSFNTLTANALTTNALTTNALTTNALTTNALTLNALTLNALTGSGTRPDASTAGVGALQDLNGVTVEGVVLPMAARP